jgi:hypothetical protein
MVSPEIVNLVDNRREFVNDVDNLAKGPSHERARPAF